MKNSQVEKHFKILVGILELTKYLTTSKKTRQGHILTKDATKNIKVYIGTSSVCTL